MMPELPPEVKAAVQRLRVIRRELRSLETEEALLRDLILATIAHWPAEAFPVRVGEVELSRQTRPGRVDEAAALRVLEEAGLLQDVPTRLVLDADRAAAFEGEVAALKLPAPKRGRVLQLYRDAVHAEPDPRPAFLAEAAETGQLLPDQYRACFQKARPQIPVVIVR